MRKTVTAAALAASITVGGAAGAVLFQPTISSAQTDDTTDESTDDATAEERAAERETRHRERLSETLNPLVEDGTIDQTQSDAVVDTLIEARPERGFGGGKGGKLGANVSEIAEILGMTTEELRTALSEDQTLADIAAANGVAVDDLVAVIVDGITERLDSAVADGRLTEDEAAEKLAEATERATDAVNGEGRLFDGRGHRGHHGPRGDADAGDADAEAEAEETVAS